MTSTVLQFRRSGPRATRTRKPNRRPGSVPVTQLHPRQLAQLSERAVFFGNALMSEGPEFAREVGEAIRLSLLQELASS